MSALPSGLSDLLELAVRDARACEARPDLYTLDMSNWHYGRIVRGAIHCNVCMAGAVMAQTLKLDPSDHVNVWVGHSTEVETVERNRLALQAINYMRTGDFVGAANVLEISTTAEQAYVLEQAREAVRETFSHAEDEENPDNEDAFGCRASWDSYLEAAGILREAGL